MVDLTNLSFTIEDGKLIKLINNGINVNCIIQDGAKTTKTFVNYFIEGNPSQLVLRNGFSFPIPEDKVQEVSLVISKSESSKKGLKSFALAFFVIVAIPFLFMLSLCNKPPEKPGDGSIEHYMN